MSLAMHRLDRSRPYATVYGMPGITWQQDGQYFHHNGTLAGIDRPEVAAPPVAVQNATKLEEILRLDTKPEPVMTMAGEAAKVAPDDMRLKENRILKVQMEQYGEEWVSVEHAKLFLAGRA
jgi:hypothetical protein